jgi:hypothetical protein
LLKIEFQKFTPVQEKFAPSRISVWFTRKRIDKDSISQICAIIYNLTSKIPGLDFSTSPSNTVTSTSNSCNKSHPSTKQVMLIIPSDHHFALFFTQSGIDEETIRVAINFEQVHQIGNYQANYNQIKKRVPNLSF